jgi:ABC-2 type transport system permease protein
MIAAILRVYWLSTRIGGGRGAVFGAITATLWYGLWTAAAVAAGVLLSRADGGTASLAVSLGLLLVCFYWQIVPVVSASMGAGLDLRKLLLFPLPHRQLFLIELLLRLASGAEMVLVLLGGAVGLVANRSYGGAAAVPRVALPLLLFVLFNVLVASGMRSLVERIMTRRKVREIAAVVLALVWGLPRILYRTGAISRSWGGPASALQRIGLPWAAAAQTALGGPWLAMLWLALWALAAWAFARRQFERTLHYDALAMQATPLTGRPSPWAWLAERLYRFPGLFLPDPLAGIVEKELRSLARTPRFRMVFIMGFTFGLMVWFPSMIGRHELQSSPSPYFLPTVCLYSLTLLGQVTYWNCFGFDRGAAALYFVAPPPIQHTLLGKNVAALLFIYLEVLILTLVTAILRVSPGWTGVAEMLVVVGICSLYMLALGNLSSVNYPRALTAERATQGARGGARFQGLIFMFYPVTLLPVFLAYLARYAFNSQWAFILVLAIAAMIGGVLYGIAMESAASTARQRREAILAELSRT